MLFEKLKKLKKYDPEKGKEVAVYAQFCPFEIKDCESGKDQLSADVEEYIIRNAQEEYERDEWRNTFICALETCCAENSITQDEHDIVCLYLGIGDGYDEAMPIKEIAKEFEKSYSYVRNHLLKAGKKIRKKMQEFYSQETVA